MKRSPLRRRSTAQAKLIRANKAARAEFLEQFSICWFCQINASTDTHEILSGPCRKQAYAERCCWGAACRVCNCDELTDKRKWSTERQLAVKFINDPDHWNLERVNEIRRGIGIIHWADVVVWICREMR